MAQITPKENYLRMAKGETPEWIPALIFGVNSSEPPAEIYIGPYLMFDEDVSLNGLFMRTPGQTYGKNIWGVPFVATRETGYCILPEPGNFILDDITKWRDVIKAPDISKINWEEYVRQDLGRYGPLADTSVRCLGLHFGYFQTLMSFMGFENGMMAMMEEPEEVMALFEYLCDFYCSILDHCYDLYKPDTYLLTDDVATARGPFISVDMYREMVKPFVMREAQYSIDRGVPCEMHCCGKCEDMIPEWLDYGVKYWQPAQPMNDLLAIKEKYGIAICGGWPYELDPKLQRADISEEEFKKSIRDTIDKYAPGGRYAFFGCVVGDPDDESVPRRNQWAYEVVEEYGRTFYQK